MNAEENNDLLSGLRLKMMMYVLNHRQAVHRKKKEKKLKPLYKFSVKNEIAYTEDHVPVQKLHLFGLPMELTQEALLDYFTQNYGPNVVIERIEDSVPADEDQEYLPSWSAFALFAHAGDAAKVLQSSEHLVNSHQFHVQPCYSWLQPNAVEETNESEFAIFPDILKLNDDCLECVFHYLRLSDQIRLAQTCTHFLTIYQRISARRLKSICSEGMKDLTLWEARKFCQLSGHHVHNLSLSQWGGVNFKRCFYADLHFPNLTYLNLHDYQLKVHKLQRILMGTSKLKELKLKTQRTTDPLELEHLKELKKLKISDWNTESLTLPTSIESLTVSSWREFSCLPKILQNHTQIKKLRILNSNYVFDIMSGSQAFASIEVLDIRGKYYEKLLIAQLPKLKKLRLEFDLMRMDIIHEIIEINPKQLDHLEFTSPQSFNKEEILHFTNLIGLHTLVLGCPYEIDDEVISAFGKLTELKRFGLLDSDITDSLVLKLLITCPKLSILKLESCGNVSENLVHSIISLVRKEIQNGTNQRELPFKLFGFEYEYLTITVPDNADVVLTQSRTDWFEEELEIKN